MTNFSGNERAAKGKSGKLQEEGHACPVHDVQEKNQTRSLRQGVFCRLFTYSIVT